MALSVGQRYVRINEPEVRKALNIDPSEKIVGVSLHSTDIPNVVVFILEKINAKEAKDEHQESLC